MGIFAQIFYCYEGNVPNVPVACFTRSLACQMYNDWMNILFNIVIPSGLMAIFGVLTIVNIRRRIIYPLSIPTVASTITIINMRTRLRKVDHILRKILFIQVSLTFVFTLIKTQ